MNLWEFLKYSDKNNVFKIYTKEKEINFSWNGNSNELNEHRFLLGNDLADWNVLSFKHYPQKIKVFIELDQQKIYTYNNFPETENNRKNYNKKLVFKNNDI